MFNCDSLFSGIKKARDARRQKKLELSRKKMEMLSNTKNTPPPIVEKIKQVVVEKQPVVEERSPTPVAPVLVQEESPASAVPTPEPVVATTTGFQDQVNMIVDNVVNPENHPDPVPAVKSSPSDEPTDEDDDDSQDDDDDDKELDDVPTTSTTGAFQSMVQDIRSEESKLIETISPPNSIKPIKETMETFAEEQRAQQNAGYLCGCI
jgi:hypothetical protein